MKISQLALVAAIGGSLAACGGGGSGGSSNPPVSSSSSVSSSSLSSSVESSSSISSVESSSVSSSSSSQPALEGCDKYNSAQGFASLDGGTTGGADVGAGNSVVYASTGAQIRSALSNSNYSGKPLTIYVDGLITWENSNNAAIQIRRNDVSIIGNGNGEFVGVGIEIRNGASNIIIRNLKMHEYPQSRGAGDLISLDGRDGPIRNIWIDHNELYNSRTAPAGATCPTPGCDLDKDYYDELVSGRGDVGNITISYNYLHSSWKTSLWGSSDTDDENRTITFHHNHWRNVGSRLPLFRFGEAHLFNNYYYDVSESGINSRMGARMRIDGNHFERVRNPIVSIDSSALGFWTVDDNIFQQITQSNSNCNGNTPPCYGRHQVSTIEGHTPPYQYSLMPASDVKDYVVANAGVNKINACLGVEDSGSSSSSSSSSSVAPEGPASWNAYSANQLPGASGAITLASGGSTQFTIGGNDDGVGHAAFTQGAGVVAFDTTANAALQHHATLHNVVADDGVYPKHFTLVARVQGNADSLRGLEFEVALADAGEAGSRVKMLLRPESRGVQLEQANNGNSVQSYSNSLDRFDMDGFNIYHLTISLSDPVTGSVNVYLDGSDTPLPNLSLSDVTMRPASSAGANYLRFGDGGGNAYKSSIDWIIWSDEGVFTPGQLKGQLPAGLGELGAYE